MDPIKTETSINFIERELIKRQDLNILWTRPTDSVSFIKYMSSERDLSKFAKTISDRAEKTDNFPLYVFLNVQYDIKDGKHSELIIITKYHEKYSVGFFDSNGPLSENLRPDKNIHKILNHVATNLNTEYFEYMEGKTGINIIGKGNCDAFCLWLVYLNRESSNKTEVCDIFNEFYQEVKKGNIKDYILKMNKEIDKMSKKR
jgi:hypothetical protein